MRNLPIAYGNSCYAKTWTNKTTTFNDLCERLKTTVRTTETAEEYPKLPKADRDRAKDKGGFVGGQLRDNRRKRETVACRSMLTLDCDHAEPDFITRFTDQCTNAACVYTTHGHTPEAPRVRIIVPLTRDITPDEYAAISRYFSADWGIDQFDECSYRPHQLMYWPTTPANGEYIFKRIEGGWLDPDKYLAKHPSWQDCSLLPTSSRESTVRKQEASKQEDPFTKTGVVGAFCRAYTVQYAIGKFLSNVYEPSAVEGRYDYISADSSAGVVIYDDKFAYSHHATDPACGKLLNAFDLVRIHKFGDDDDKKSFAAMVDFAVKDEVVSTRLLREKQESAAEEFEDWTKALRRDRGGLLQNSLHNITLIMENDENLKSICFNQLADGMEIKGNVPWQHPARFWRDADDAQLICYVDANYGTFSARNYQIAVAKVVDDRSYHPIREYLASLPPWDGVPRVDTILIDYLSAEDNAYTRAVTRKTLCGAVARVKHPGIKFDNILVLNGDQGIGKSTLIAKLGGEWYSDSLSLTDMNDKTAAEKLQGYWLLEIGELAGMRKADIDKVKAFISRQDDKYRASFGRRVTPHPRQCVFFGTTNSQNGYEGAVSQAVFSREYENLTEQTYIQSDADYADTALIGGEGEGVTRTFVSIIGNSGEQRREVFVDAKDLRQEDFDSGYVDALTFRGQSKLSELARVQSFAAAVNPHGNLKYKEDFDLGEVVQVLSKKWDVVLTARITEIEESYDSDGQSLNIVFGKSVLSLLQKLKGGF